MALPVKEVESRIREGNLAAAQERLMAWVKAGVPRAQAWHVATLARRANLDVIGARLLHPIVRGSGRAAATATEKEKIEYAALLARFGAVEEALSLLNPADPEKYPEALLYKSFALVSQWDYHASEPLLRQYIASPRIDDY